MFWKRLLILRREELELKLGRKACVVRWPQPMAGRWRFIGSRKAGTTMDIFTKPRLKETEDYITGRFG